MVLVLKMEKSRGKKPIFRKVAGSSPKSGRSVARVLNEKKRTTRAQKEFDGSNESLPHVHSTHMQICLNAFLIIVAGRGVCIAKEAQLLFFFPSFNFFLTFKLYRSPQ
jgi:hypothetical protein